VAGVSRGGRNVKRLLLTSAILVAPWAAFAGQTPADLIAGLLPSVVNIATVMNETPGPVAGNMASQPTATVTYGQGSGFFISPAGLIVTNRHAIAGATQIYVTLSDSTRLSACLLAAAAQTDIALLRVNVGHPVPALSLADSDGLRPGDPVFIIGNPLGLGGTVTEGIVSARDRNTPQSGFGAFFQLDAALNHGSSGGPVFDGYGHVVGIATALFSPPNETGSVGLGLAIPATDVAFVVKQLLDTGHLQLGWIGAHIQPVTGDLAAALKLPDTHGAIVTDIAPDSPAARAGLAPGDVVLAVGTEDMVGPGALNRTIAASKAGSVLRLTVWRDGEKRPLPVVIGDLPGDKPGAGGHSSAPLCEPPVAPRPDLGLVLSALTKDARDRLGLEDDQPGVQVLDVVPGTGAFDRGIAPGSVIQTVERQPVASPADVQAAIGAARAAGKAFVLMLVRNTQGLGWVAVPLAGKAEGSTE
jgi:serine protease Do